MQKKMDVRLLAQMALLTALMLVMAFTPLGYIPLPFMNATTMHIPVIIGACLLGLEFGHERVVLHVFLEFAVLAGKFGILVLHLLLVEFGKLAEFFKFALLVGKFLRVGVAASHEARQRQGSSEQGGEDT